LELEIAPTMDGKRSDASKIPLGDAYVRMNDLIASYPETAPWPFGYQVDVRSVDVHESHCACLEIWLSVQTSLLDSYPQLSVQVPKHAFSERNQGTWISDDHRFCLAVHPLDLSDCQISFSRAEQSAVAMLVFGRFMEKGVLRRMRFRLFASESPQSESFWSHQQEQFSRSPLPLTT
jgi:hypothetical protein